VADFIGNISPVAENLWYRAPMHHGRAPQSLISSCILDMCHCGSAGTLTRTRSWVHAGGMSERKSLNWKGSVDDCREDHDGLARRAESCATAVVTRSWYACAYT
jgi:hypothetical protein